MKRRLVPLVLILLALPACMSHNFTRLIPENKDLDALVTTPWGTITIHSRVSGGTNALPPLPVPQTLR